MKIKSKFAQWLILTICILICAFGSAYIYNSLFGNGASKTITWAEQHNYMFAVGVDGRGADEYPNGIYTFYQDLVKDGRPVAVYDIYTSKNYYSNSSLLRPEEYKGSVGGVSQETLYGSIEDKYVYVIYNGIKDVSTGVLKIDIEPY